MQLALSLSIPAARIHRIALSIFYFVLGLSFSSWASRIPDIKEALHLSNAAFGGVLFALPLGQITGLFVSGNLVTKYGSKTILSIASMLYPAALLLIGLASSPFMLVGALYIFGICGNLYNISVNTQAVGVERLYGRSIMASFHGLWSLAGFVGGSFGALMIGNQFSPFKHYCIIYGIALVLAVVARKYLLPKDAPTDKKQTSIFTKPNKAIVIFGAIAFASMICEGTMFDWSGVYFEKVVEAPSNLSRLGFIAFMAAMATGRFIADFMITKFGVKYVLRTSGIVIMSGLIFSVVFPNIVASTIGFLLVGFGVSSVVPLVYSLAGKSQKVAPGVALAMVSSIGFLGFLLGPPIIGFISQAYGLRVAFSLIAILGLGTTLLSGKIRKQGEY